MAGTAAGGYSGTPLAQKLGIKEDATVVLIGAPSGFEDVLSSMPPGVTLRRGNRGGRELTIWFAATVGELKSRFDSVVGAVGEGVLWVAWPKKTSKLARDLTEDRIRDVFLPRGLVDTKVCAIDADWSGLRLTRRRG